MNLTIELLRQLCILLDKQGAPLRQEIKLSKDALDELKDDMGIIMKSGFKFSSGDIDKAKPDVVCLCLDGYDLFFTEKS